MTFSDETLMAYADGELDEPMRARIAEALKSDAQLARRIATHQELRARLQAEFAPVLSEPVPARLLEAAQAARPRASAHRLRLRLPALSTPQWALAASLMLGVLGSAVLWRPGGPLTVRDGAMLARGSLARALSTQLASTQGADAPVQIGVSFRTRTGQYCRTFVLRNQGALAGLACRSGQDWELPLLTAATPTGRQDYRAAGSALPPSLAQAVNARISGEPLDASAEASARARGWHP